MSHARQGALAFPLASVVLVLILASGALATSRNSPSSGDMAPAAAWPPSPDLVISEVVTGGLSANDEYVEVYDRGPLPVDLGGLELVYVTSTGSTVTRKATWTSRVVPPGGHVLIANASGVYAGLADDTYSGGLAATGGVATLRVVGGMVLDSAAWGTAVNTFVEGVAAAAPPSGESLERLPGGALGSGQDTNDNSTDLRIQPFPIPEGSGSPQVPAPSASPFVGPTPDATETVMPTSVATVAPTPDPTMEPSFEATSEPSPDTTPDPTSTTEPTSLPSPTSSPPPGPSPVPTSTRVPTPAPTPGPTPTASPAASPSTAPTPPILLSIADARMHADDTILTVVGTVTLEAGHILGDRIVVIQDGTGAICVRLPSDVDATRLTRGRIVEVTGRLANPFANRELRPSHAPDVVDVGVGGIPVAMPAVTTDLVEAREGMLVRLTGGVARVEGGSSGSLAVTLHDDQGEARVFVYGTLGVPRAFFAVGQRLSVIGVVGQRESARGLGDGYRLWPRDPSDIVELAPAPTPTPRPTATPRPSASPRPSSSPHPTATQRPSATPSPTRAPRPTLSPRPTRDPDPRRLKIAQAVGQLGESVTVEGSVTSPAGLLDADGRRVTIQDDSGALLLRLPEGAGVPALGTRVRATGEVGAYYGGPQLAAETPPMVLSRGRSQPVVLHRAPGVANEWWLVRVTVRISNVSRDGDAWRAEASMGAGGTLPIAGLADAHIPSTALVEGRSATVTGIVRRAYPTATDQRFSVVPRSGADIVLGPADGASGSGGSDMPGASGGSSSPNTSRIPGVATPAPSGATDDGEVVTAGSGSPSVATSAGGDTSDARPVTIGELPSVVGARVRIGGTVVASVSGLLTLDDGTGRAAVRAVDGVSLPLPIPSVGEVVNVSGIAAERDVGGWEVIVTDPNDLVLGPAFASVDAAETAPALPATAPPLGGGPMTGDAPTDGQPGGIARLIGGLMAGVLVAATLLGGGLLAYRRRTRRASLPDRSA